MSPVAGHSQASAEHRCRGPQLHMSELTSRQRTGIHPLPENDL